MAGEPAGEGEQIAEMDRNRGDSACGDSADIAPNKVREWSCDHPLYDNTAMGLYYLAPAHFTNDIFKFQEVVPGSSGTPLS